MSEALPNVFLYDMLLRKSYLGEIAILSAAAKIQYIQTLDQFGIDYIEVGLASMYTQDITFLKSLHALKLKQAKLTILIDVTHPQLSPKDDPQFLLVTDIALATVTLSCPTDWRLMNTSFVKLNEENHLNIIKNSLQHLIKHGKTVIYQAEYFFDAYRNYPEHAIKTLKTAIKYGCMSLILSDTSGGATLEEVQATITFLKSEFIGITLGISFRNNCGLAVALSLVAVKAGANLIQGTQNGCSNFVKSAHFTTLIPNLIFKYNYELTCRFQLSELSTLSRYINGLTNQQLNPNQPFVGSLAFTLLSETHKRFIELYPGILPESVGNQVHTYFSHYCEAQHLIQKAREFGIDVEKYCTKQAMKLFIEHLQELYENGCTYDVAEASLELLMRKRLCGESLFFEALAHKLVVGYNVLTGSYTSEAVIKLNLQGILQHTISEAQGAISALDSALRKALEPTYPQLKEVRLTDFKVHALDNKFGIDASTKVHIECTDEVHTWVTVGVSPNVVEASWMAIKEALEYKLFLDRKLNHYSHTIRRLKPIKSRKLKS